MKGDPIDQAIAGPARPPSTTVEISLPAGASAILTVPNAITDSQWLALIGRLVPLRDTIRKMAGPIVGPDPLVAVRGELPKGTPRLTD